ncbi:MAG: tail fiber domain-containing protein [Chthoniobacterales bacterium]
MKPMDKASEVILALQPVTFHYKPELDPAGIPQFGLVAEQVEKVNPDLVARDEQGKPYTVR